MTKMLNNLELDYIRLISSFIKEEINFEKYSKKRGITPRVKLNEVKYLLFANPMLLNLFLAKLPIGARCLVMKSIFDLNDRQIEELSPTYNSKTSISNFIKSNFTNESKNHTFKKGKNTIDFIYNLSIILDIPSRFLANPYALSKVTSTFEEYDQETIQIVTFQKLIEDAINKTKNMIGEQRTVFGVKINHFDFVLLDEGLVNARVDIRAKYFTLECHIKNEAILNYTNILKIQRSIGRKSEIFIRDAFLRRNKKLIILINTDYSVVPKISYLGQELRMDHLYSLDNLLAKRFEDQ